jgi:hypothetical protein
MVLNYSASVLLRDHIPPHFVKPFGYVSVLMFMVAAPLIVGVLFRVNRRQEALFLRLANTRTPEAIPVLAGAVDELQKRGKYAIDLTKTMMDALSDRLTEVARADSRLWMPRYRSALRELLRRSTSVSLLVRDITDLRARTLKVRQPKLALAALAAIEQIGSESDLHLVAAVAHSESPVLIADPDARRRKVSIDGTVEAVRLAATRCLEVLERRVEEAKYSETLLRPSESAGNSLLRPPAHDAEADEYVLLRSHAGKGDA